MTAAITDRELLDLAARAAGIALGEWSDEYQVYWVDARLGGWWNPLTDDGDAQRLSVKLRIPIWFDDDATITDQRKCGDLGWRVETGAYDLGGYAATRRAIVLAAAEIGRCMP